MNDVLFLRWKPSPHYIAAVPPNLRIAAAAAVARRKSIIF